jgi:hypothetical protein
MRIVKLYAIVVTAIFVMVGAHRLMFVEAGVPTHWPSAMRFKTSCLTSTVGLTQSFKVTAEGVAVAGITLLPAIASGTSGQLLFELRDTSQDTVRYKGAMPIADLATDATLTVKIPPAAAPADGRFTSWIGRSDDTGCLAFQASAVAAPDAQLTVGNREVLGDLLFQVHADRGTAIDGIQRWVAGLTRITLPSTVLAVLALVYALAIGALCWMLTAGSRGSRARPNADAMETSGRASE